MKGLGTDSSLDPDHAPNADENDSSDAANDDDGDRIPKSVIEYSKNTRHGSSSLFMAQENSYRQHDWNTS